jgi:hypothetical protein
MMFLWMSWIGMAAASGVVINEVLVDAPGADAGQEWVELYNGGSEPTDLGGWVIRWGNGDYTSEVELASEIIHPGAFILMGSEDVGAHLLVELDLGNGTSNSDAIQLIDNEGTIADTVVYGNPNSDAWLDDLGFEAESLAPTASAGRSIARTVDGVDTERSGDDFSVLDAPTPARSNVVIDDVEVPADDTGLASSECTGADWIKLNEVMVNPDGADAGHEWIELYNAGTDTVNLGGWGLQSGKSGSFSDILIFSSSINLAPGGFLLVGDGYVPGTDVLASLDMGNAGSNADAVRLMGCDDAPADTLVYGTPNDDMWLDDSGGVATSLAPKPGESTALARIMDGYDTDECGEDWIAAELATPGAPNPVSEPIDCVWGARQVKINEFMPDPEGADAGLEWVELYNSSDDTVSIDGWTLAWGKNGSYSGSKVFSVGTDLGPGAHLLVGGELVDPDVDVWADMDMGNAGSNSDAIQLVDCEDEVQDTVVYGGPNDEGWVDDSGSEATSLAEGPGGGESLARVEDGEDTDESAVDFVVSDDPSPGAANPYNEPVVCVPGALGIKINELLPNPEGEDSEGEFLEIYNTRDDTVSLSGWGIAAGTSSWPGAVSYLFPTGATIPTGGFLVVGGLDVEEADFYMDDDNKFSLGNGSKNPDGVRLVDCVGEVQDTVLYGSSTDLIEDFELDDDTGASTIATMPSENLTLGRRPDGADSDDNEADFVTNMPPTPGFENVVGGGGGGDDISKGCGCGGGGPSDPEAPVVEAGGVVGLFSALGLLVALRRRED